MRPRRGTCGNLGRLLAAVLVTSPVDAQQADSLELEVERAPGAEDCPDAIALRGRFLKAGARAPEGAVRLAVRFERAGGGYEATVRASGVRTGVRTFSVPDHHCGPLVDAVSVSVVLLLDPEAPDAAQGAEPGSPAASQPAAAPGPSPPERAEEPAAGGPIQDREETGIRAAGADASGSAAMPGGRIDLTPTLVLGLTPRATFGAELGATLRWPAASVRLGGAAFLPRDDAHAGGSVEGFLLSARASACLDFAVGSGSFVSGCATGLAARLRVKGTGFTENGSVVRPLWAAGPEVAAALSIGQTWGWGFRIAPLFLLAQDESFFVAGTEGTAFRVAKVSAWLGISAWSKIW